MNKRAVGAASMLFLLGTGCSAESDAPMEEPPGANGSPQKPPEQEDHPEDSAEPLPDEDGDGVVDGSDPIPDDPAQLPPELGSSLGGAPPALDFEPHFRMFVPTLVDKYQYQFYGNTFERPAYDKVRYLPRGFVTGLDVDPGDDMLTVDEPGPYAGWDLLHPPLQGTPRTYDKEKFVSVTFNRPTRVALVWRDEDPLPPWFADWQPGPSITLRGCEVATYQTTLPAGESVFGSTNAPGDTSPSSVYLLLFAEESGQPSAAPGVPHAGLEHPLPVAHLRQTVVPVPRQHQGAVARDAAGGVVEQRQRR